MSQRIQKKRNTPKKRGLEVNTEATRILKTVSDKEAFYFYEAIGRPTGESAKSLFDFLEKIKTVKLQTLAFHLQRKDFQNWINKTIGDSKLAKKVERIQPSNDNELREKIHAAVENRIKELRDASLTLLVDQSLAIVSPSPP